MLFLLTNMGQTWLLGSEQGSAAKPFIHSDLACAREAGSIRQRAASGKTNCGGGGRAVHRFFKVLSNVQGSFCAEVRPLHKLKVLNDCLIACLLAQLKNK